jgi:hypothetical protein
MAGASNCSKSGNGCAAISAEFKPVVSRARTPPRAAEGWDAAGRIA